MQLYVLSPAPEEAARLLQEMSPKRAFAQFKEGMQMLAAHPDYPKPLTKEGERYKDYWKKHPVTKWVIGSQGNFSWTVSFMEALSTYYPQSALTKSLNQWKKGLHIGDYDQAVFSYFGSWDVPGETVFEKYHEYLRDKLLRESA
jgi:hypothetical protein